MNEKEVTKDVSFCQPKNDQDMRLRKLSFVGIKQIFDKGRKRSLIRLDSGATIQKQHFRKELILLLLVLIVSGQTDYYATYLFSRSASQNGECPPSGDNPP